MKSNSHNSVKKCVGIAPVLKLSLQYDCKPQTKIEHTNPWRLMKNQTNKLHLITIALPLLIGVVSGYAEVITLKAGWTITNGKVQLTQASETIKLGANQVARILHFFCNSTTEDLYDCQAVKISAKLGEVTVLYSYAELYGTYQVDLGGAKFGPVQGAGIIQTPTLAGPATVELVAATSGRFGPPTKSGSAICTIEIVAAAPVQPPATIAVEVPPDNGPVDIALETSTDMQQTWQTAALGRYGAIGQKRFFRLKAVKLEP